MKTVFFLLVFGCLTSCRDSVYDIVVPGHFTLVGLIERGLVAPLRHENIPNLKNIDPQFVNPAFDPGNEYGAPYLWGTTGIYTRAPKAPALEETWGLLFDPAKQAGSFLLLEDFGYCIGAALNFKGYQMNATDPRELAEARELLVDAKKRSLGFASSYAGKNRVLAKDAVMAFTYNTDAMQGQREDPDTRYFIPKEGGGIWLDTLSIPAKAPHRDLAEKFINHLLDAKAGARVANFTKTATANKAARDFVDPADLANPGIYPPPDVMRRLEYVRDLGARNSLRDELWVQIKSK